MRDALYLSETILSIDKSGNSNDVVKSLMQDYQEEILSRGSQAVRLSRNEWSKISQEERSSWGSKRSLIPRQKVVLDNIAWARWDFIDRHQIVI